jgi:hypothetical protein
VIQRVKDADRFQAELDLPLGGRKSAGAAVTDAELQRDAESFMAFASVMGITPPSESEAPAPA